jgi:hypothetical protein
MITKVTTKKKLNNSGYEISRTSAIIERLKLGDTLMFP